MVNAAATIDLPNCGCAPITGFSDSSLIIAWFGERTLDPSTKIPFAPKNDRIEQFWIYGDLVIIGLVVFEA